MTIDIDIDIDIDVKIDTNIDIHIRIDAYIHIDICNRNWICIFIRIIDETFPIYLSIFMIWIPI